MKKENTLAIITARGGSKRIPRKNIKPFLGKPVITYVIDAARQAGIFNEVMVSTDDGEIADLSRSAGASVPFLRSAETAGDHATTTSVIAEVLGEYAKQDREFTYCCCLYPVAVFVTPSSLKKGFERMTELHADAVIPVVRFSYPVQRALKIEQGKLAMLWPENMRKRSQDLPPVYHDAGQFYWLNVQAFLKGETLFPANTVPLELPETEVQDIDNDTDWILAELKYRHLHGE